MSSSAEIPFSKIFIYIDCRIENVKPETLKEFLKEKTGREVRVKENFLQKKYKKNLAKEIAKTKVRDKRKRKFKKPLPKEIEIEKRVIEDNKELLGMIYDGNQLTKLLQSLLNHEERKNHTAIITKRLIGTLEKNESHYHIRTVINSIPSIISISGIVEGPAKPRDHYFADRNEKEDVLDFEPMRLSDKRMESAVKSYLLQTIFWRLEGYPFCDREGCCLYNSHWQKGVIKNQVNGDLCEEHQEIIKKFKKDKPMR